MAIIPKARRVVNLALIGVFTCNAAAAGITLVVRHPQGDKHNTQSNHTRAAVRNIPAGALPREKGVVIYATSKLPIVTREGERVAGVVSASLQVGAYPRMLVQVGQRPRIRIINFESGKVP